MKAHKRIIQEIQRRMPGKPHRLTRFIPCYFALLLFCSIPFSAQQSLDPSRLIDGLAERGMNDLLLHLARTGTFEDSSEQHLLVIAQLRLKIRDATLPESDRLAAVREARAAYETLLGDPKFKDHPQRPIWRTDLADLLLTVYLDGFKQLATGFYEFGVPTTEQRRAFEEVVPLAAAHMLAARDEFTSLEARLRRDPALREKLESSMTLYRINDDYRARKSAYFGGFALYYASLLPDEHPYFTQLAATPGMPGKPAEIRVRLRSLAVDLLGPFLREEVGSEVVQLRARSLAGRATLRLGNAAAADRDYLTPAAQSTDLNPDTLGAMIAQALAHEAQGRAANARSGLTELCENSSVKQRLAYRLLVTDALHLLLLRMAESAPEARRAAEVERAYGLYFTLLSDPSLAQEAEGLRTLIYDRWASSLPADASAQSIAQLPPAVRMAVADISRRRGLAALQQGDTAAARGFLQRAVDAGSTLQARGDVGDAVWAGAMYNLAYAKYALDPSQLTTLLDVVNRCADIAEQTPELSVATDALDLAGGIIEPLHRQHAAQPGVTSAYDRVMQALYESGDFDQTKPADDRLAYYAYVKYQSAGDYARAADLYDRQVRDHPNYLEAQSQRMVCLAQVYRGASADERAAMKADLLDTAQRLSEDAGRVRADPSDAYQAASADRALANARLARAEVFAADGETDKALRVIDTFEKDFAGRPEMIRRGLERRILLMVEAGKFEQARDEAAGMMDRFPDAAAGVIHSVLGDLERKIDAAGEGSPQAVTLAETASALAKLLADWAAKQDFTKEQMLSYHLVALRSLRIADKPAEAIAYLRSSGIEADFPHNLDVLMEKALALIGKGDPDSLRAAVAPLNTILGGLHEPYPPAYWQAWVARLGINLKLDERVDDVPRRIRQLAARHPDLGGEPYKSQLEQLQREAAGKR